jgi:hypothetical protein
MFCVRARVCMRAGFLIGQAVQFREELVKMDHWNMRNWFMQPHFVFPEYVDFPLPEAADSPLDGAITLKNEWSFEYFVQFNVDIHYTNYQTNALAGENQTALRLRLCGCVCAECD